MIGFDIYSSIVKNKLISIDKIENNDFRINEPLLHSEELEQSIRTHGLLNPITVFKDKKYEVLSGNRRLEICKKLERKKIEARIITPAKFSFSTYIYDMFENPCEVCDYPSTEKHHIVPRHFRGDDDKDNLISLCPTHHSIFDFLTKIHVILNNTKRKRKRSLQEKMEEKYALDLGKIQTFDKNALIYFDEFIKPRLPQLIKPTDAEIFISIEKITKNLEHHGKKIDDISQSELDTLILEEIQKLRKEKCL